MTLSMELESELIRLSLVDIFAPPRIATEFFESSFTLDKALNSSSSNRPAQALSEKVITPVVDACALWDVANASITNKSAKLANLLDKLVSLVFSPILNRVFSITESSGV